MELNKKSQIENSTECAVESTPMIGEASEG
jgi:hypothetical protein